ncbi:MAG: LytTR family transcriptional regulator DNA-binding domain-containing protein [Coriobacteriia bacterium]|nr:LytTR family transcriptional regulator DNA-binding domain-containing protein [Coriobacteriia bacterium]
MKIEIHEGFPETEVIINCQCNNESIQKIAALLQGTDEKLSGLKDGALHVIDPRDVFYFDTVDKRYFIYTEHDVYETHLKLYEIERLLPDALFFRSSKSQVINIAKIASLWPDIAGRFEVVMKNEERVIVSRRYARALKERLGLK